MNLEHFTQRWNTNRHFRKWLTLAPLGLATIGFGLSLTGEAIRLKSHGRTFSQWFGLGTVGLIVVNTGIAFFGDAVKERLLYEANPD